MQDQTHQNWHLLHAASNISINNPKQKVPILKRPILNRFPQRNLRNALPTELSLMLNQKPRHSRTMRRRKQRLPGLSLRVYLQSRPLLVPADTAPPPSHFVHDRLALVVLHVWDYHVLWRGDRFLPALCAGDLEVVLDEGDVRKPVQGWDAFVEELPDSVFGGEHFFQHHADVVWVRGVEEGLVMRIGGLVYELVL